MLSLAMTPGKVMVFRKRERGFSIPHYPLFAKGDERIGDPDGYREISGRE